MPRAVRDAVLKEFNHRCAKCGADNPHVHHINEDPSDNDPQNLIPLCPNCHLTDHHDPTRPPDRERLALFRKYRDPTIFRPEFVPLFERMAFLRRDHDVTEVDDVAASAATLIEFVSALAMGGFYAKQLADLVKYVPRVEVFVAGVPESPAQIRARQDYYLDYLRRITANREEVERLAVELLRYQPWAEQPE